MIAEYNIKAHHIGCLTKSIENSIGIYSSSLGFKTISEIYTIHDQKVKVCFVEITPSFFVELVEPIGENPALNKILKSGNPFYHIGYLSDRFEEDIARMVSDGFYQVNTFISEAFLGKKCAFLYTPEMHLIELIEK